MPRVYLKSDERWWLLGILLDLIVDYEDDVENGSREQKELDDLHHLHRKVLHRIQQVNRFCNRDSVLSNCDSVRVCT